MSRIVVLEQGSEAWLNHRALHRNASETAAVMAKCPWMTPYQLWEVKTGRRAQASNHAMTRGLELEPMARAAYEVDSGMIVEPVVMVDGDYSASLDGLSFDGRLILEIKCPMHGRDSETWKAVADFKIPDHYHLQVQHQLMVSGAAACDFYVWDGKSMGICLRVTPDVRIHAEIRSAWDYFWSEYIVKDAPPPLTPADTVTRNDRAWVDAAQRYIDAKEAAEGANKDLEGAREALVALSSHNSERGYGVSVCRYWKGTKASKEEVRVTVLKEQEEEQCKPA